MLLDTTSGISLMAGGDVDEFGIIIIMLGISGNSFSFLTEVGAR